MSTNVKDNRAKGLVIKITKYAKVCKQVYSEMIQNTREKYTCEKKWCSQGVRKADENWKDNYVIPFKVTTENKLCSFQYHVLRRSLVTTSPCICVK